MVLVRAPGVATAPQLPFAPLTVGQVRRSRPLRLLTAEFSVLALQLGDAVAEAVAFIAERLHSFPLTVAGWDVDRQRSDERAIGLWSRRLVR